ncbi:Basic leucine zipper transcriptional factor ATF-like 3, partial [Fukomys damarensis]
PAPNVTSQSPDDDDRKVRRREKNRVAAQRSRKKQTQKADKLHEHPFQEASQQQNCVAHGYQCAGRTQDNQVCTVEVGAEFSSIQVAQALPEYRRECGEAGRALFSLLLSSLTRPACPVPVTSSALKSLLSSAALEYECLEQENAMLRREIAKLNEELQQLSLALKEHEKMCPLLLCPMNFVPGLRPDPVASCLPR